jgi:hypothetical protein
MIGAGVLYQGTQHAGKIVMSDLASNWIVARFVDTPLAGCIVLRPIGGHYYEA